MNIQQKILFFIVLLIVGILIPPIRSIYGQINTETITATVKLSLCGDTIVESPEDCEGSDLNGASCASLNYGGGTLSCDIACTFDTTNCILITPTPTLTMTPTPQSNTQPTTSLSPLPTTALVQRVTPTTAPRPQLPFALRFFDLHKNGTIQTSDIALIVKIWVDEWKRSLGDNLGEKLENAQSQNCDTNEDTICNLIDFSVLLFYVDR